MEYPNWFEQIAQYNFDVMLQEYIGKDDLRFLQLGAFTGDASVWLCKNVLTGDQSYLYDVDTWAGAENEPIQEQMDFEDVFQTYLNKTTGMPIEYRRMTTTDYLYSARLKNYPCDFIYVDAHHTSASAFLDCELSWPLLKSGGLLAIDDYEWLHPDGVEIHAPKLGIHMFLDRHEGEFDTLIVNQQYWLRKR